MKGMTHSSYSVLSTAIFTLLLFLSWTVITEAATLKVSPDTGIYSVGGTFSARVLIDTAGNSVNAAEGQLSFNPHELSVVSVSRATSIFNLWTQEPTFSNVAGTISFGGGSPSGYSGGGGAVISIVFRALGSGNPKVTFTNGSALAADGLGTNVLTSMKGASYTVSAPTETPEPEYIAPANTPKAPVVTSTTHPDQDKWYRNTTAELAWEMPSGVVAVRTLLDENPTTIPTIVYDVPISSRTIEDLPQGISYFHIQFKNAEGWGKITHYRLAVDSDSPSNFIIQLADVTPENPKPALAFTITDISPVTSYLIQIDGQEPITYTDENESRYYELPQLSPGHHTVIIEAFDAAGNSLISTYAFDIVAFVAPVFTEYPTRLGNEVVPVFRGTTKPNASVLTTIIKTTGDHKEYTVTADPNGQFTVIPESPFDLGVYDMHAVATDESGGMSEESVPVRFVVEEPGYLRVGSLVLSVLSVIVPLLALVVLMVFGIWYLWHRLSVWRKQVTKETREAEQRLALEFETIATHLSSKVNELKESRKGKLTKAEEALINEIRSDINSAQKKIQKEISDIDDVVK